MLDSRGTLNMAPLNTNVDGDAGVSFQTIVNRWLGLHHLASPSEKLVSGQIVADAETVFYVRYDSTVAVIDAKCEVSFKSETYQVLAAFPIPAGRPNQIEIVTRKRRD